jgi:hypothetical protein
LCHRSITTYRGQGPSKKGLTREEVENHAVVYASGTKPFTLPTEQGMIKDPIEVMMATPDQKLDKMSRLNFQKIYSVEHNVQAMDVGLVSRRSIPYLLAYWQSAINNLGDTATQEYAPASRSVRRASEESKRFGIKTKDETFPPSPYNQPGIAPAIRSARGATEESTTYGKGSRGESISGTADKQSGTEIASPFSLPKSTSPEISDKNIGRSSWKKNREGRLYRYLTVQGKDYTQWDHDQGPVILYAPSVSTASFKPEDEPKNPL